MGGGQVETTIFIFQDFLTTIFIDAWWRRLGGKIIIVCGMGRWIFGGPNPYYLSIIHLSTPQYLLPKPLETLNKNRGGRTRWE